MVFAVKSFLMVSKLHLIHVLLYSLSTLQSGSSMGHYKDSHGEVSLFYFFCLLVSCTTNERRKAHFTTEHKTLPTLAISASSSTSTSSTMTLDGANRVSTV